MKAFLANLVLALLWAALVASVDAPHIVVGFAVGYLVLWAFKPLLGDTRYFEKLPRLVSFVLFFAWELLLSNLRVAWDVVTPKTYRRPGVIAVPLEARTDAEITLLANLITLTPGTLSLDVSADRKILWVHAMFVDDPEQLRQSLKHGFERRVLELLR